MEKLNYALVALAGLGLIALAVLGLKPATVVQVPFPVEVQKVVEVGQPFVVNQPVSGQDTLGAGSSTNHPFSALSYEVSGTEVIDSSGQFIGAFNGTSVSASGDITASGEITGLQNITAVANTVTTTATTTLTVADTGNNYIFSSVSSTVFVLPATSTASGVYYRFTVGGALTGDVTIRTSDLGDNIEGTLIVAGAVVDCDAEDTITFVSDGENIGDYFEIYSDGTYWYLGDSGALTASKLTCSTT